MEWQQRADGIWGLWDNATEHLMQQLPVGEAPPNDGLPQYPAAVAAVASPDTGGFAGSAVGVDAGNAASGMGAALPDIGGSLQSWLDWLKSLLSGDVNVVVPWMMIGGAVVVIYAASHSSGRRR